jgi:branched-chain amino acid transport system substrate-binding protein
MIRAARELGYKGLLSTETAQDANTLKEGAGDEAEGFISVGGASTPEIASDYMKQFVAAYTKKYGEYNDESNTKCYALEYIVDTIKADPKAIDDVAEFQKEMDSFSAPNPFVKTAGATLQYVGTTSFGQKRQISVPMVVDEYKGGAFQTLFVGTVD